MVNGTAVKINGFALLYRPNTKSIPPEPINIIAGTASRRGLFVWPLKFEVFPKLERIIATTARVNANIFIMLKLSVGSIRMNVVAGIIKLNLVETEATATPSSRVQ